jgi:PAS domain S-box-containing protein
MVFPDPACRAEAARFVQSLEPGWRDWKVTAKDGSIVESSWAKISLSDDTWIGIGIDIRERKRAEAAVRESEARLAAILENLPVGVWIVDSMGRVTAKNKAADLVWGGDAPLSSCPEEYVEYVAWDVETGDRMEADDYPLTRALRTGLPTTPVELRIRRFDGAEGFIMMSTALLRGPDGLLTGAVGINVDITEQKRAEETIATDLAALTRMHDMSGRLLDSEGIQPLLQGIMDTAVVVVGAEKGTLQLLEGDALRIVAFHDHQEPFLDFFASAEHQVSACGEAMNYKSRAIIPDVETAPLFAGTPSLEILREAGVRAVQSTPLVSRSGALVGILTTHWSVPYVPDEHDLWRLDLLVRQAADLIEIARTEEALRQHTEELTRLHGDLKVANREANLYLDILTHDIGNTENVSNLYAELLIESLDSEAAGYAKKLQRSIQKSIEILGTVSTIRRIHRTTAELRPMDLDAAVRGVIEDFPTGIVRYSGAHHMVRADDLLSVIFDNLIGNAVKHGGPGVEITVRTEDTDGCVLVSVEDTGPGVPDEEKDAIFHRYEKKKRGVGEGLGLYLVQILVERYGGKVWVEDRVAGRPEEGAAFRFSLQKA